MPTANIKRKKEIADRLHRLGYLFCLYSYYKRNNEFLKSLEILSMLEETVPGRMFTLLGWDENPPDPSDDPKKLLH